MSASLVGSEMCIRDSSWRGRARRSCARMTASATSCRRRASASIHIRGGPVSYTHLTLPTICSV
eukprot:8477277-Alexandrium_andersonii.AAC.1